MEDKEIIADISDHLKEQIIDEVASANAIALYRQMPPDYLNDREKEIWIELVESVDPTWLGPKDRKTIEIYARNAAKIELLYEKYHDICTYIDFADKNHMLALSKVNEIIAKSEGIVNSSLRLMRLANQTHRPNRNNQPADTLNEYGGELYDVED